MGIAPRARVRSRWLLAMFLIACSQGSSSVEADASSPDRPDAPPVSVPDAPPDGPRARYLCKSAPPVGAVQPPLPPAPTAGTCPTLANGLNSLVSSGQTRELILVVPASPLPDEVFPVLFMWHWIGGTAQGFLTRGEVQAAADQQRFIAVIPVASGANVIGTSFNTKWPFDISQSNDRMQKEFKFFDDMLSCVNAQFTINRSCVSTIGVSAGALFTDQLAQARSQYLSSFVSLSGGVGATWIKPWDQAARKLPAVILWGGDGPPQMDGVKDILGCFGIGMDFSVASRTLEQGLVDDGHFFIECKHNCGHVEPPLTPPMGESKYAGMWEFAMDHPYWLAPGESPYKTEGLPPTMPEWCAIGANSAVPRSGGGCPAAENPCVN
jgi:S-formylglutathione hydrolase FrmB